MEYKQDNSEILTSRTDTCYLEGKTVQCTKVFFFPTNACHKEFIAKKILKNSISTIRNNFPNSFPHVCKHAASLRSLRWGNLSRPPLPASTHSIAHTHTHTLIDAGVQLAGVAVQHIAPVIQHYCQNSRGGGRIMCLLRPNGFFGMILWHLDASLSRAIALSNWKQTSLATLQFWQTFSHACQLLVDFSIRGRAAENANICI